MMIKKGIIAILVLFMITGCGVLHLTPTQEELLYKEHEPVIVGHQEVTAALPSFAYVSEGYYILVPRGLVTKLHDAPWCTSSFYSTMGQYNVGAASVLDHKDWDSSDYALELRDVFVEKGNYAFGVAWNSTLEGIEMVNIFVDEEGIVILYDPYTCQFVRLEINNILIGIR